MTVGGKAPAASHSGEIAASLKNTYYGRYLEAVAQEARHQY